jgi:hypothetical protein
MWEDNIKMELSCENALLIDCALQSANSLGSSAEYINHWTAVFYYRCGTSKIQ